jgi:hypothetical protein
LEPYFVVVADKIVAAAAVVQVNIVFVMEVVDTDVSVVVAAVVYEILVVKNKNLLLLLLVVVLGVAVAVSNLVVAAAVVVGDGVVVDGVEYNVDIRLEILALDFRNNNLHDAAVEEDAEKLVVNIQIAAVVYSVVVTVDDSLIEQLQVLDNNVVAAAVADDVNLVVDKLAQIQ